MRKLIRRPETWSQLHSSAEVVFKELFVCVCVCVSLTKRRRQGEREEASWDQNEATWHHTVSTFIITSWNWRSTDRASKLYCCRNLTQTGRLAHRSRSNLSCLFTSNNPFCTKDETTRKCKTQLVKVRWKVKLSFGFQTWSSRALSCRMPVSCSIEAKFWRISAKLETMAVRLSMATARDTYLSSSVTKRPLSVNKRKERHLSRSSFPSLPVLSVFLFLFSLLFLPFPCNVQLGTRASPTYPYSIPSPLAHELEQK